jgi:hypothetical protein
MNLIQPVKDMPCGIGADRDRFLEVLDWFMHVR